MDTGVEFVGSSGLQRCHSARCSEHRMRGRSFWVLTAVSEEGKFVVVKIGWEVEASRFWLLCLKNASQNKTKHRPLPSSSGWHFRLVTRLSRIPRPGSFTDPVPNCLEFDAVTCLQVIVPGRRKRNGKYGNIIWMCPTLNHACMLCRLFVLQMSHS